MKHRILLAVVWVAVAVSSRGLAADELSVKSQPSSGVLEVGQPITWQIKWQSDDPPQEVSYKIKRGGKTETSHGELKLVNGTAELVSSLDEPGSLLALFAGKSARGEEVKALGGAIVAPRRIKSSSPRPADFDAFWDAKIEEIEAVPFNAQLEKADSGRDDVDYWKIALDGHNGTKIRGQLAKPAAAKLKPGQKLPAMFIPQWAGVYPLEKGWVTDRASQGWLVLNILAHDLPIDEKPEFYQQQMEGPLKDYWAIGNDDRDTSYFLRMYLSCYQAIEYLLSRPDWNGKTLVVTGASQGGQQTLVSAALHPQVTAAMAMVPAGCDMFGPEVGRAPGWPQWYDRVDGKDAEDVREASRYFDAVNFAPRIKCPMLVGFGLIDEVCPPEGIMAAVNEIDAQTEAIPLPLGEHLEKDGSHQAYYKRLNEVWLPALRDGKAPPVAKRKREVAASVGR